MTMNRSVRSELDRSVLCWLATAAADGMPNVSPKEIFGSYGEDAIVIADIASPVSVRNVLANPKVCVSFVDVFRQRGFKMLGTARIIAPEESDFRHYGSTLLEKAGSDFPIRHVILVSVASVARIMAPSYLIFPERTEQERMREAYRAYGVKPTS